MPREVELKEQTNICKEHNGSLQRDKGTYWKHVAKTSSCKKKRPFEGIGYNSKACSIGTNK